MGKPFFSGGDSFDARFTERRRHSAMH